MLIIVCISALVLIAISLAASASGGHEHRDPDLVHVPHHGDRPSDR